MANKLEYWDGKLHLEKIRELMKVVLVNQSHGWENFELKDIEVGKKIYNVSLGDDAVSLKCSDGRNLFISLNPKSQFYLDVSPKFIYMMGKDKLTVKGDDFKTSNVNVGGVLDRHFVFFDDFYNDDQLIRNINFYTVNGKNNVSIEFNGSKNFIYRIFHKEYAENYYFKINDDTIVLGNGIKEECLVTLDGKKIISYNGQKLPSFEEIEAFDYKEQIEKIKNMLNEFASKINSFTIDYFNENLSALEEKQELRDKYMGLYNYELPVCREALQKRNEFLNNLDVYTFSENELEMLINLLKEEIIARINKDKEQAVVKKKSLNR